MGITITAATSVNSSIFCPNLKKEENHMLFCKWIDISKSLNIKITRWICSQVSRRQH